MSDDARPRGPGFSHRTNWNVAPNPLSQAIARARAEGVDLLDLTESNPTRCGFIYDQAAILMAFQDPAVLSYCPDPRGLLSARAAVAAYYDKHGIAVGEQQLVLTSSTSEAYSFLFRLLCNAGDEVLAPSPSYPLFDFLGALDDVVLRSYELVYDDGWQIDFSSLRGAITAKTRAVLLVNPNNPTGSFVKQREREQLNTICAEHGLALIADEVFLDYDLPQGRSAASPRSSKSFASNTEVLTFTLSGLSKIAALPQMKAAWIVVSGPEGQQGRALQRLEVIADTFLSVSTPVQLALPNLLEQGGAMIGQLRDRVTQNLRELDRQFRAEPALERLHVEGGWYAVLRVPVTRSDEELAVDLIEQEHVIVHPGHFYEFHRDGHLVASLITPREVFREGMERVIRFAQRL